jgi:hypothetical protein
MSKGGLQILTGTGRIARGRILRVEPADIVVECDGQIALRCDVLADTRKEAAQLYPGDAVLVFLPEEEGERGCILGSVTAHAPRREREEDAQIRHLEGDEIVLAAKRRVEIRVGASRIVITEDGKILIHGTNVTSRAKASNKIKGAVVAIN